jgi:hypothetical protein
MNKDHKGGSGATKGETAPAPQPITHTVLLTGGIKDLNGGLHREIVFGHRITGGDLMLMDTDPQATLQTQYKALIMRGAIIKAGTLPMPIPTKLLLQLDDIDRDDLDKGHDEFQQVSAGGRSSEILAVDKVQMAFGFDKNGNVYNRAQFGNRLTGVDELKADQLGLSGVARACFLIGKQIIKLSTEDEQQSLEGEVPLEWFETLDGADIYTLRSAAEAWRQTFRRRRTHVPK